MPLNCVNPCYTIYIEYVLYMKLTMIIYSFIDFQYNWYCCLCEICLWTCICELACVCVHVYVTTIVYVKVACGKKEYLSDDSLQ